MVKTTAVYLLRLILEILLILLLIILIILIIKYVLIYIDIIRLNTSLSTSFKQELTYLEMCSEKEKSITTNIAIYLAITVISAAVYKYYGW